KGDDGAVSSPITDATFAAWRKVSGLLDSVRYVDGDALTLPNALYIQNNPKNLDGKAVPRSHIRCSGGCGQCYAETGFMQAMLDRTRPMSLPEIADITRQAVVGIGNQFIYVQGQDSLDDVESFWAIVDACRNQPLCFHVATNGFKFLRGEIDPETFAFDLQARLGQVRENVVGLSWDLAKVEQLKSEFNGSADEVYRAMARVYVGLSRGLGRNGVVCVLNYDVENFSATTAPGDTYKDFEARMKSRIWGLPVHVINRRIIPSTVETVRTLMRTGRVKKVFTVRELIDKMKTVRLNHCEFVPFIDMATSQFATCATRSEFPRWPVTAANFQAVYRAAPHHPLLIHLWSDGYPALIRLLESAVAFVPELDTQEQLTFKPVEAHIKSDTGLMFGISFLYLLEDILLNSSGKVNRQGVLNLRFVPAELIPLLASEEILTAYARYSAAGDKFLNTDIFSQMLQLSVSALKNRGVIAQEYASATEISPADLAIGEYVRNNPLPTLANFSHGAASPVSILCSEAGARGIGCRVDATFAFVSVPPAAAGVYAPDRPVAYAGPAGAVLRREDILDAERKYFELTGQAPVTVVISFNTTVPGGDDSKIPAVARGLYYVAEEKLTQFDAAVSRRVHDGKTAGKIEYQAPTLFIFASRHAFEAARDMTDYVAAEQQERLSGGRSWDELWQEVEARRGTLLEHYRREAMGRNATIVFPEAEASPEVRAAAAWLLQERDGQRTAGVVLFGNRDRILKEAARENVDLSGAVFLNPEQDRFEGFEESVQHYYEKRLKKETSLTIDSARQALRDNPVLFGAYLVRANEKQGYCLVTGKTTETGAVMKAVILTDLGIHKLSSAFVMLAPFPGKRSDAPILVADVATQPMPTVEELAEIIVLTAQNVRLINTKAKPVIAVLAGHEPTVTAKAEAAIAIAACELGGFAEVIGPAAFSEAMDRGCDAIVLPDLVAANPACKILQYFGGYDPMIIRTMGAVLGRMTDLSRGASVREIQLTALLTILFGVTRPGYEKPRAKSSSPVGAASAIFRNSSNADQYPDRVLTDYTQAGSGVMSEVSSPAVYSRIINVYTPRQWSGSQLVLIRTGFLKGKNFSDILVFCDDAHLGSDLIMLGFAQGLCRHYAGGIPPLRFEFCTDYPGLFHFLNSGYVTTVPEARISYKQPERGCYDLAVVPRNCVGVEASAQTAVIYDMFETKPIFCASGHSSATLVPFSLRPNFYWSTHNALCALCGINLEESPELLTAPRIQMTAAGELRSRNMLLRNCVIMSGSRPSRPLIVFDPFSRSHYQMAYDILKIASRLNQLGTGFDLRIIANEVGPIPDCDDIRNYVLQAAKIWGIRLVELDFPEQDTALMYAAADVAVHPDTGSAHLMGAMSNADGRQGYQVVIFANECNFRGWMVDGPKNLSVLGPVVAADELAHLIRIAALVNRGIVLNDQDRDFLRDLDARHKHFSLSPELFSKLATPPGNIPQSHRTSPRSPAVVSAASPAGTRQDHWRGRVRMLSCAAKLNPGLLEKFIAVEGFEAAWQYFERNGQQDGMRFLFALQAAERLTQQGWEVQQFGQEIVLSGGCRFQPAMTIIKDYRKYLVAVYLCPQGGAMQRFGAKNLRRPGDAQPMSQKAKYIQAVWDGLCEGILFVTNPVRDDEIEGWRQLSWVDEKTGLDSNIDLLVVKPDWEWFDAIFASQAEYLAALARKAFKAGNKQAELWFARAKKWQAARQTQRGTSSPVIPDRQTPRETYPGRLDQTLTLTKKYLDRVSGPKKVADIGIGENGAPTFLAWVRFLTTTYGEESITFWGFDNSPRVLDLAAKRMAERKNIVLCLANYTRITETGLVLSEFNLIRVCNLINFYYSFAKEEIMRLLAESLLEEGILLIGHDVKWARSSEYHVYKKQAGVLWLVEQIGVASPVDWSVAQGGDSHLGNLLLQWLAAVFRGCSKILSANIIYAQFGQHMLSTSRGAPGGRPWSLRATTTVVLIRHDTSSPLRSAQNAATTGAHEPACRGRGRPYTAINPEKMVANSCLPTRSGDLTPFIVASPVAPDETPEQSGTKRYFTTESGAKYLVADDGKIIISYPRLALIFNFGLRMDLMGMSEALREIMTLYKQERVEFLGVPLSEQDCVADAVIRLADNAQIKNCAERGFAGIGQLFRGKAPQAALEAGTPEFEALLKQRLNRSVDAPPAPQIIAADPPGIPMGWPMERQVESNGCFHYNKYHSVGRAFAGEKVRLAPYRVDERTVIGVYYHGVMLGYIDEVTTEMKGKNAGQTAVKSVCHLYLEAIVIHQLGYVRCQGEAISLGQQYQGKIVVCKPWQNNNWQAGFVVYDDQDRVIGSYNKAAQIKWHEKSGIILCCEKISNRFPEDHQEKPLSSPSIINAEYSSPVNGAARSDPIDLAEELQRIKDLPEFKDQLQALIKVRGFAAIKDFAREAGIGKTSLYNYVAGRSRPTRSIFAKIVRHLDAKDILAYPWTKRSHHQAVQARCTEFAQQLNTLMALRGTTIKQIAEAVGVTIRTINRYLTGDLLPTAEVLARLASALGVKVEDLWPQYDSRAEKQLPADVREGIRNLASLGEKLSAVRRHYGLLRSQAAKELNIGIEQIRLYEDGQLFPNWDVLENLGAFYQAKDIFEEISPAEQDRIKRLPTFKDQLEYLISRRGFDHKHFAEALQISRTTLWRKLNHPSHLSSQELAQWMTALEIEDSAPFLSSAILSASPVPLDFGDTKIIIKFSHFSHLWNLLLR
ncbi:MAG: helix-turn-helix domain-containing protein, partial [Candidatus Omnitrophica bacterium]|nr:helix-turn-helix domain-containing protein [Candidatus Omnitrophota bacterium]